jgi:ACS family tartrate transporter-like MFS transporter
VSATSGAGAGEFRALESRSLEARVARKLSARILPFTMLLYLVSFLDRVNVGFAAFTMNKAIGLTPAMFGFGGGIFFLGYILFQVPANLLMVRVGARVWIARVVVAWGAVSVASAFVAGPHSFYLMRFLLGAAEAGFFPGTILYLSIWFPARHRAAAIAVFMAAAPLSSAVGSPISGALMELPRLAGLANWQWLYILEGLPAILLGFLTLKVLTDGPREARWLEAEERAWLVSTLDAERVHSKPTSSAVAAAFSALGDPRVLALAVIYSGTSAALYVVGLWAPQIIQQFGYSSLRVGWINVAPSLAAAVVMVLWGRRSDRMLERTWHVALPCLVGCAGLVWAGYALSAWAVVAALTLANIGCNAPKGPLWALPCKFLSGAGAAAGIAWINCLGNLGGFIGPWLTGLIKGRTGSYAGGLSLVGAMMALSAVMMLALSRRLEPEQREPDQESREAAP